MTPAPTYESLAGILNQTLLGPGLSNAQVVEAVQRLSQVRGGGPHDPADTHVLLAGYGSGLH